VWEDRDRSPGLEQKSLGSRILWLGDKGQVFSEANASRAIWGLEFVIVVRVEGS